MEVYCVFEVINDKEYGGNRLRLEEIQRGYSQGMARVRKLSQENPNCRYISQGWKVNGCNG